MPDRHFTDEEVHAASGHAPRTPPAVPKATCLGCGHEHDAFYAAMAHDCEAHVRFAENGRPVRDSYANLLALFKRLGFGVLRSPKDAKFPPDKQITVRVALTQHLQSDLFNGPNWPFTAHYSTEAWDGTGYHD
jgi:hypothetical protein